MLRGIVAAWEETNVLAVAEPTVASAAVSASVTPLHAVSAAPIAATAMIAIRSPFVILIVTPLLQQLRLLRKHLQVRRHCLHLIIRQL